MVEDRNIGRVLDGKYELIRLIGAGGMGGVYEARHLLIGRRMAVKLLHAEYARDQNVVQRFKREATNTSAVGHDNIVEITDMGVSDTGELYLVMEYLDGRDLASVLAEVGRTSQGWACHIVSQVLSALEATHAAGIVHRDLKPANVFVTARPETESFVKLVDFGISKVRTDEQGITRGLTRTGEILGTPQYMSPEQARGQTDITGATDIYSTGVMLYEILTGQQPYQGKTYAEILFKILAEEPPDPAAFRPDLAPGLLAAIRQSMANDPAQRFASAAAFLAAIVPYADPGAPIAAGRISAGPSASVGSRPVSRRPASGSSIGSTEEGIRLSTTPLALSGDVTVTKPARTRWLIPLLAGVGGLVLIAVVAAWFVSGRSAGDVPPVVAPIAVPAQPVAPSDSAEPMAGSPSSTAGPALKAAADVITLTLQVTPAKAQVLLDGKELGRGSGSWEFGADEAQHTLEIAAKGWSNASRTISLTQDLTLVIGLEREDRSGKEEASAPAEPTPEPPTTAEPETAQSVVIIEEPSASAEPKAESSTDVEPPKKTEKAEPKAKQDKPEEKKFKRKIDEEDPW